LMNVPIRIVVLMVLVTACLIFLLKPDIIPRQVSYTKVKINVEFALTEKGKALRLTLENVKEGSYTFQVGDKVYDIEYTGSPVVLPFSWKGGSEVEVKLLKGTTTLSVVRAKAPAYSPSVEIINSYLGGGGVYAGGKADVSEVVFVKTRVNDIPSLLFFAGIPREPYDSELKTVIIVRVPDTAMETPSSDRKCTLKEMASTLEARLRELGFYPVITSISQLSTRTKAVYIVLGDACPKNIAEDFQHLMARGSVVILVTPEPFKKLVDSRGTIIIESSLHPEEKYLGRSLIVQKVRYESGGGILPRMNMYARYGEGRKISEGIACVRVGLGYFVVVGTHADANDPKTLSETLGRVVALQLWREFKNIHYEEKVLEYDYREETFYAYFKEEGDPECVIYPLEGFRATLLKVKESR